MTAATRITPFTEGGKIEDRIDEIVARRGPVHIEMLYGGAAWMKIGDDVFTIYVERGKLIIAWRNNERELRR